MTLETYIELSSLKEHNKIYLKNLFRKYVDSFKKDLHYTDYKFKFGYLYPDNVLRFMKEKM